MFRGRTKLHSMCCEEGYKLLNNLKGGHVVGFLARLVQNMECNPTHDKQACELIAFLFVTNATHMLVFVIIVK
jgi:hypothetical protein